MKCNVHPEAEMAIKERVVGWGSEEKLVCPECEEEKRAEKNGRDKVVSSAIGRGWSSI